MMEIQHLGLSEKEIELPHVMKGPGFTVGWLQVYEVHLLCEESIPLQFIALTFHVLFHWR